MAMATLAATKLRLTFSTGVDSTGAPVYKVKTFNNIKKEATTDQLFQTAQALGVLSNDPLNSVERNDTSDVVA